MMPNHIFWPIIDCCSLYATRVTHVQGVVLRRFGGRGHFPVTWQRWRSYHSIRHCQKLRAIRKFHGYNFYRTV